MSAFQLLLRTTVLSVSALLATQYSVAGEKDSPRKQGEELADHIVSHLRKRYCAAFPPQDRQHAEKLLSTLSESAVPETVLAWSFSRKDALYSVYAGLLKQALIDSQQFGADVLDAWAFQFLLRAAPPETVLEIIVPEMNPGGPLQGVIDTHQILRKYLEESLEEPLSRSFVHYRKYLHPGKSPTKVAGLLSYMFRTDPYRTVDVLASAYMLKYKDQDKTRELLWLCHASRLVVFSRARQMSCPQELEKNVKSQLNHLLESRYWFERAFALVILERNRYLLSAPADRLLGRIVHPYPEDPHLVVRVLGRDLYRERLKKPKRHQ